MGLGISHYENFNSFMRSLRIIQSRTEFKRSGCKHLHMLKNISLGLIFSTMIFYVDLKYSFNNHPPSEITKTDVGMF